MTPLFTLEGTGTLHIPLKEMPPLFGSRRNLGLLPGGLVRVPSKSSEQIACRQRAGTP